MSTSGWSAHMAELLPSAVGCGLMHLGLCMGVSAALTRTQGRDPPQQHSAPVVRVFTSIRLLVQLVLAAAVVCSIAVHSSTGSGTSSSSSSLCGSCGVLFKAAAAVLPPPVAPQHVPTSQLPHSSTAAAADDDHSSSSSWSTSEQPQWLVMQLLLHSLVSVAVYQVPRHITKRLLLLEAPLAVLAAVSAHPSGVASLMGAASRVWHLVGGAGVAGPWASSLALLAAAAAAVAVVANCQVGQGAMTPAWRLMYAASSWFRSAIGVAVAAPVPTHHQHQHQHQHQQQQQQVVSGQQMVPLFKPAPAPAGEEAVADMWPHQLQPQPEAPRFAGDTSNSASSRTKSRRRSSSGSSSIAVHPSGHSNTLTSARRGRMAGLVPDRSSISSSSARDEARNFSQQRLLAPPDVQWQFDSPFLPRIHTNRPHTSSRGVQGAAPAAESAADGAQPISVPSAAAAAAAARLQAAAAAGDGGTVDNPQQQERMHYHSRRQSNSSFSGTSIASGSGTGQPRSNPSSAAADGFLSALNQVTGDARSATTASTTSSRGEGLLPQQRQRRSLDEVERSIKAAVSSRTQQEQPQQPQGPQVDHSQLVPSAPGASSRVAHPPSLSSMDGSVHDLVRCPSFCGIPGNDTINAAWFSSSHSFSGSPGGPSGLRGPSFTPPATPLSDPGVPQVHLPSPSNSSAGNYTLPAYPWQMQGHGLPPRPVPHPRQVDDSVSSTEGLLLCSSVDAAGAQGLGSYPDLNLLGTNNSFTSSSSMTGRPAWGYLQPPSFAAPTGPPAPAAMAGPWGSGNHTAAPWYQPAGLGHPSVTGSPYVGVTPLEELYSDPHTPAGSEAGMPRARNSLSLTYGTWLAQEPAPMQQHQQQQRQLQGPMGASAPSVEASSTSGLGSVPGQLERAATMAIDPSAGLLFSAATSPSAAPAAATAIRSGSHSSAGQHSSHGAGIHSDPGCARLPGTWAGLPEVAGAGGGTVLSHSAGRGRPYQSAFAAEHHQQMMQDFMASLHNSRQG